MVAKSRCSTPEGGETHSRAPRIPGVLSKGICISGSVAKMTGPSLPARKGQINISGNSICSGVQMKGEVLIDLAHQSRRYLGRGSDGSMPHEIETIGQARFRCRDSIKIVAVASRSRLSSMEADACFSGVKTFRRQ
jgi:hypothetical protein